MSNRLDRLTPEVLLRAYAAGLFPMAESADAKELRWFDPPLRGVIPLDGRFHVPRRLRRTILKRPFEIRLNTAFRDVIRLCAEPTAARNETWINDEIASLYTKLYEQGHAHSVEAFYEGKLVGGLYGVSLGGAFFGESMFSRRTDASKIALVYLVALLRHGGFTLLDAQFQTEHLAQFGAMEITRSNYQHLLEIALEKKTVLSPPSSSEKDWNYLAAIALQPVTHKS